MPSVQPARRRSWGACGCQAKHQGRQPTSRRSPLGPRLPHHAGRIARATGWCELPPCAWGGTRRGSGTDTMHSVPSPQATARRPRDPAAAGAAPGECGLHLRSHTVPWEWAKTRAATGPVSAAAAAGWLAAAPPPRAFLARRAGPASAAAPAWPLPVGGTRQSCTAPGPSYSAPTLGWSLPGSRVPTARYSSSAPPPCGWPRGRQSRAQTGPPTEQAQSRTALGWPARGGAGEAGTGKAREWNRGSARAGELLGAPSGRSGRDCGDRQLQLEARL